MGEILGMLANLLLGGANAVSQGLGTLFANLANEGRYQQGFRELENLRRAAGNAAPVISERYMREWEQLPQTIQQAYSGIEQQMTPRFEGTRNAILDQLNNLVGGYQSRYDRNMAYLEGAGQQERKDILQRFADLSGQTQQALAQRGLANSTILPSLQSGLERQKSDALGGLEERLRQQRLDTDAALSGDVLAARQAAINYDALARGTYDNWLSGLLQTSALNQLNAQQAGIQNRYMLDMLPLQMYERYTMPMVNWIGERQDVAPDEGAFLNQMYQAGFAAGPEIDYPKPSSGSSFWPSLAGGTASGAATAGMLKLLFCHSDYKTEITSIDDEELLRAARRVPVYRWRYRPHLDPEQREHCGPLAEDFAAAVGLGSGRDISVIDAIGLLLGAVRSLADRLDRLEQAHEHRH